MGRERRSAWGRLAGAFVGIACSPAAAPTAVEVPFEVPRLDGGAPQALEANEVRFLRTPFEVGSRWATAIRATSRSTDAQGDEQNSAYVSEYEVLVLAVASGVPTRVRVAVKKNHRLFGDLTTLGPVNGKTYVLDASEGEMKVSEGASSPAEVDALFDMFPDLGTRMRVDEVLPDAPMQIGARRDELAGAILRVIHPRAWKLDAGKATLVRREGDLAVFEVAIDASRAGQSLTMSVKGQAYVRLRDARLVRLELSGPYVTGGATPSENQFALSRKVEDR